MYIEIGDSAYLSEAFELIKKHIGVVLDSERRSIKMEALAYAEKVRLGEIKCDHPIFAPTDAEGGIKCCYCGRETILGDD